MDPESPPPIIDGDFLRRCLLYEYLKIENRDLNYRKTKEICYIPAANMSQMFISESIRNDIPRAENVEDTPMKQAVPVSEEPKQEIPDPPESHSAPIKQEEPDPDEPFDQEPPAKRRREIDQGASSEAQNLPGSSNREPKPEIHDDFQEIEQFIRQSKKRPSTAPEEFFPEKREDSQRKGRVSSNRDPFFEDIKLMTASERVAPELKLLKHGEKDFDIDIVSPETINDWLHRFKVDGRRPKTLSVRKTKKSFADVRSLAYTFFGPQAIHKDPVFQFQSKNVDDLKIIIGPGSIKMEWIHSKFPNEKGITLEYWKSRNGSWIWIGDDVRFIEGFEYDHLACHEFINMVRFMRSWKHDWVRRFNRLAFGFEDPTKWSFYKTRSVFFSQKIKEWMVYHEEHLPARVLSTTLYEKAPAEFQPFLTNLMAVTEKLQFSVWRGDGSNDPGFKTLTVFEFLEQQANSNQWEAATWLSMQDEILKTFTKANFSFNTIQFWDANVEFVRCLIQQKLTTKSCSQTILKVHQEFRIADFHGALGSGNFEDGVYSEKGENGTIRVTFDEKKREIIFRI